MAVRRAFFVLCALPVLAAVLPAAAVSAAAAAAAALDCDLLFAGGRVVDGTGAPWFRADVCVAGGRIAAVGQLAAAPAPRRIDPPPPALTPGGLRILRPSQHHRQVHNRA